MNILSDTCLKAAEDRMIPRMIENQSVTVDSICGATSVSAGIKAATEDALKKALAAGGADPSAIKNSMLTPSMKAEKKRLSMTLLFADSAAPDAARVWQQSKPR